MRVMSLFSGIGGIDLGLERAGMRVVAQVEIDPFCLQVLAKHWPEVPRYDDIRTFAPTPGAADLVAGGFPCQDISVAGKGAGIDGEKSGLWREMRRVVGLVRPAWVLVENSPALRTRGADRVLADLEELGYACWPLVVGAEDVGAPHKRKRGWVVAHANRLRKLESGRGEPGEWGRPSNSRQEMGDADCAGLEVDPRERADSHEERSPSERASWPTGRGGRQQDWEPPRTLGRRANGVSRDLARWNQAAVAALGNAVVPQVVEAIGRAILTVEGSRNGPIARHP